MAEETEIQVHLNPEEIKVFSKSIDEIVKSMVRIKGEQESIKESCATNKEKYGIPLPVSRKVATFILNESKQEKAESELDLVDYLVEIAK